MLVTFQWPYLQVCVCDCVYSIHRLLLCVELLFLEVSGYNLSSTSTHYPTSLLKFPNEGLGEQAFISVAKVNLVQF